jgi:hypothetical protein
MTYANVESQQAILFKLFNIYVCNLLARARQFVLKLSIYAKVESQQAFIV